MSNFIKNQLGASTESFSYDYSLRVPFDPITGSNASIELNPKGRTQLLDAAKLLEESHPGLVAKITKVDPKLAHTKFLSKVGIHGELHAHEIGPLAGLGFTPQSILDGIEP